MSDVAPPTDQVRQRKAGKTAKTAQEEKSSSPPTDSSDNNKDKDGSGKSDDKDKDTIGSRLESVRQRIRSPLMGSMKLDEIRESISKNVEVK
jgi:hypothetical protein